MDLKCTGFQGYDQVYDYSLDKAYWLITEPVLFIDIGLRILDLETSLEKLTTMYWIIGSVNQKYMLNR